MRFLRWVPVAALVASGILQAVEEPVTPAPAPSETVPASFEEGAELVGQPSQTSGKVVSVHSCQLVDISVPHVLVKILTEEGETDIVDLGPAVDLKSNGFEPREGQQLWVNGRIGRINDKELLVAESLSESKLVAIVRTAPLREESEKHAAARGAGEAVPTGNEDKNVDSAIPGTEAQTTNIDAGKRVRTVEGAVIDTRAIKIEGQAEEHVFCKLQTEVGIVVVDLGTASRMPKVDLGEGKSVAVTGYVGQLNGEPIIVADAIGNLTDLSCAAAPAPQPAPEK